MHDPADHYERHLAKIYAWSVGGADAAIAEGARWLATLPLPSRPSRVLDLGAGFGATAIPLARAGHEVVAVDTSRILLDDLAASGVPLRIVQADLLDAIRAEPAGFDVVLCVGDTLAHLPSREAVDVVLGEIARVLSPGGLAVLSYRPRRDLAPEARFVLVRSDAHRTLTAFLEPVDDDHQIVWDVIHEHAAEGTALRVSGYRKLRLEPVRVAASAATHGLAVEDAAPYRGMTVQLLRSPA